MFGSIGFPEIILIFVVVLLVFGPNKLPEVAKMMGKTIREFKRTVNTAKATIEEEFEKSDLSDLSDGLKEFKDVEKDLKKLTDIKAYTGLNDDKE